MASRLGWSSAKVSRIETAHTPVTVADLRRLLELYRITGPEAERLESLARTARQRGWWAVYGETLRPEETTYIGLEAEATSLHCYDTVLLNGLLQTEAYTRALFKSASIMLSPGQVERRVQIRRTRQLRLRESDRQPLNLSAVLDEAALRRHVGGPDVMRDQLLHLAEVSELPNVVLQVLPYSAGAHAAMAGAFAVFNFPHFKEPEVVYIELMSSELFIEDEKEVYQYTLALNDLRSKAFDPADSVAFIRQIVDNS